MNPRELHPTDGPALVVVGVDGSATGWHAFAWACGHARSQRVVEELRAELARTAQAFGVPIRFEHRVGDPAHPVPVPPRRGRSLVAG